MKKGITLFHFCEKRYYTFSLCEKRYYTFSLREKVYRLLCLFLLKKAIHFFTFWKKVLHFFTSWKKVSHFFLSKSKGSFRGTPRCPARGTPWTPARVKLGTPSEHPRGPWGPSGAWGPVESLGVVYASQWNLAIGMVVFKRPRGQCRRPFCLTVVHYRVLVGFLKSHRGPGRPGMPWDPSGYFGRDPGVPWATPGVPPSALGWHATPWGTLERPKGPWIFNNVLSSSIKKCIKFF